MIYAAYISILGTKIKKQEVDNKRVAVESLQLNKSFWHISVIIKQQIGID